MAIPIKSNVADDGWTALVDPAHRLDTDEKPAKHGFLEQDLNAPLQCRETSALALAEAYSPEAHAFLLKRLSGDGCPMVPEGSAMSTHDVILALGRKLKDREQ